MARRSATSPAGAAPAAGAKMSVMVLPSKYFFHICIALSSNMSHVMGRRLALIGWAPPSGVNVREDNRSKITAQRD
jgi:hypothetical protein